MTCVYTASAIMVETMQDRNAASSEPALDDEQYFGEADCFPLLLIRAWRWLRLCCRV